ncbi:hypothetical protein BD414DRAFT_533930 [Trametes punicea]|nr:hypothetical protein BD414DRAFT_533930 [Trametes punicea]
MPSDATEAALGLLGLTAAFTHHPPPPPSPSSITPSSVPAKRKQPPSSSASDDLSVNSDTINCICGLSYDDGFSIACDSCARWCHAACFQIDESQVPDEWLCWRCNPRPVDKDRAVKIQRSRQRAAAATANANKRRASPGVERKPRRPSGPNPDPGHGHSNKRKRRASITAAAHAQQNAEDEHVDIDEPWQQTYVPITKDIVKSDDARDRLRRVATDWRGVSAISPSPISLTPGCSTPALLTPDAIPSHPPITLQPLPNNSASSSLFAHGNTSVRPPSYAVHATQPIPSSKLIAPYPSTIISTAAYLADPLNAYAHLGMPKPFVHLIGPPLDVALDARFTGDQSRFVRSGCRPNAVIRPVICQTKKSIPAPEDTLSFGIFALRDLKPNEEVVLGWEWDDGNVVHHLPALIESPFSFPPHQIQHFRNQMTSMLHALSSTFTTCACGAKARDCALARMAEFVENQTPLTPSPSPPSQFTKEKNAARGKKSDHLNGPGDSLHVDLGPLVGIERGFRTRERIPFSGGMGGVEMVPLPTPTSDAEAGPSRVHSERDPSTSASGRRVSFPDDLLSPPVKARRGKGKDRKGKARADDSELTEVSDADAGRAIAGSWGLDRASPTPEDGQDGMEVDDYGSPLEEKLPPKLRKAWIRQSAERLQEQRRHMTELQEKQNGGEVHGEGEVSGLNIPFDSRAMPPPPVLPSRTSPLSSVPTNQQWHQPPSPSPLPATNFFPAVSKLPVDGQESPSTPFSKLSLLSPVVPESSRSMASPDPSLQRHVSSEAPSKSQSQTRKRRSTTSRASAEGKEPTKKSKARSRQDRAKDKESAPRTPVTPTIEELEESSVLSPSLVRKESTNAAKRTKSSSASSASVSPRISATELSPRTLVKEVSPRIPLQEVSPRPSAAFPSPATAPDALPPTSAAVPSPAHSSTPLLSALPVSSSATGLLIPSVASDSPEEIKEDTMAVDVNDHIERQDVEMSAAAMTSREAVVQEVRMEDERPASPTSPTVADSGPPAPFSPGFREPLVPSALSTTIDAASPSVAAVEHRSTEPPAGSVDSSAVVERPPENAEAPALASAPAPEPAVVPTPETARPRSPTPPPPPPPKVKLSLKDFALRKKKQREEKEKEEKERALATPSPSVTAPALPPEAIQDAGSGTHDTTVPAVEDPTETKVKDVVEDTMRPRLETQAHPESKTVTVQAAPAGPGADDETLPPYKKDQDPTPAAVSTAVNTQTLVSPVVDILRPPTSKAADVSVKAEAEVKIPMSAESVAPAPEPPPDDGANSQDKMHDFERRHAGFSPQHDFLSNVKASPGEEVGAMRDLHQVDSFRAKVELLEDNVPNGYFTAPRPRSSFTPPPRDYSPTSPARDRYTEPLRRASIASYRHDSRTPGPPPIRHDSRTPPPPTSPRFRDQRGVIALQASQEDGEIFSPPPPKPPPLAPRAHTPPTQPRSFYAGSPPPSRRSPPAPVRRPLHPASYRNGGPGTARPLPSAPRALRTLGGHDDLCPSSSVPPCPPLSTKMPPMSLVGQVTKVGFMNKTATVTVSRFILHPKTGKRLERSKKYLTHDESNSTLNARLTFLVLRMNDTVLIRNCPPISARKRFTLEKVIKSPEREREALHARQAAEAAALHEPTGSPSQPEA